MALEITRSYKNASDDIIRVDTIIMEPTTDPISSGINRRTFYRRLSSLKLYGPASRVVAGIDFITNADVVDIYGYTYAEWTDHDTRCNMSDLPAIGDTV